MILLDTHAVLWLGQAPQLLSKPAVEAITSERQSGALAIADKTLWEIAHLVSKRQVKLHGPMRNVLAQIERQFEVLAISSTVAELAVQFSAKFPKDPADRLIAATALAHSLHLVTADKAIRASGEVPTIW